MVFLHYDGTQEWSYQQHRKQAGDGVGVPMKMPAWQQIAHQRQYEGEHQGNGSCCEYRIGYGVDGHLLNQRFPLALLLGLRMAHRKMVQHMNELVGQMLLHHLIGRQRQTDHVRRQEGGDDTHRYDYRIEEVADNAKRQAQRGDDE